ncbi:MAG TPA: hypothetical protein DIT31_10050 [Methylophaga sp.]|nr:hypothetical protein [Methylophaga sp.]
MHGSSSGTVVINISPMSEKEAENERLKKIARHSEKITSPGGHSCPSDMDIVRDSDVILYDHMDDDVESSLFSADRVPDFIRAMGATDEEVVQLQAQAEQNSMRERMEPAALANFKRDYADYQRFGGDTLAMELDREMAEEEAQMSDSDMDSMLNFAMDSKSMIDMSNIENEAMAALEEQFGRDVLAVMDGSADGFVMFSVDSPEMGRVKYVYDSKSGEGRVMKG